MTTTHIHIHIHSNTDLLGKVLVSYQHGIGYVTCLDDNRHGDGHIYDLENWGPRTHPIGKMGSQTMNWGPSKQLISSAVTK